MLNLTEVLRKAEHGDQEAAARLFELVYEELKQLAGACMAHEGAGHTLQPTALVHETYLRLMGPGLRQGDKGLACREGRGHFFSAAAEAMRRILIDSARRKRRQKRGGDFVRQPLDPDQIAAPELADELLAPGRSIDPTRRWGAGDRAARTAAIFRRVDPERGGGYAWDGTPNC